MKICFASVVAAKLPLLHGIDQILKGRLKLHEQSTKRYIIIRALKWNGL